MKRTFLGFFLFAVALSAISFVAVANAQEEPQAPVTSLLTENFSYPVGQLTTVSGGSWVTIGGTGNFIPVVSGSLSYTGYAASGIGNKVQLVASTVSSEDVYRDFAPQTAGKVYASFLVNIANTDLLPLNSSTTGEYFAGLISSGSTSAFADRVAIRQGTAPNTIQLGFRATGNAGNTAVFSGDLPVGTTHLVVISYEIVAGAANDNTSMWINPAVGGTEPAATFTQVSAADSTDIGRFFLRQGSGSGVSTPNADIDGIRIGTTWSDVAGSGTITHVPSDFNGDGKTDFGLVRPGAGGVSGRFSWYIKLNGPGTELPVVSWGLNTDSIVPADYDGDGKADIAIWRQDVGRTSGFYVINSSNGTFSYFPFGQAGDDPFVVADYTGDGKADPAIYRPGSTSTAQSQFWFLASSGPVAGLQVPVNWGLGSDFAVPGDYTGDGIADFTVYRSVNSKAVFYTHPGSGGGDAPGTNTYAYFGLPTDNFVPGDYDGDRKTDYACTRIVGASMVWYILQSSTGAVVSTSWGLADDYEVQGDYNGDGKTDIAVWRPSTTPGASAFYALTSGTFTPIYQAWGMDGDIPTAYDIH